jgi:hypothetical protein
MWHLADGGACQGRPACRTATGWTRTTPSEAPPSLQWLATMYSLRPSSPPSMHEKQPRSAMTVSSTSPPSATRVQRCPGTLAYQIAPSASAQMPSGAEPGPRSAQTRRSTSSPESVIEQRVSLRDRRACRDGNVHDEPPSVEPRLQWPGPVKQPRQPSEAADRTFRPARSLQSDAICTGRAQAIHPRSGTVGTGVRGWVWWTWPKGCAGLGAGVRGSLRGCQRGDPLIFSRWM